MFVEAINLNTILFYERIKKPVCKNICTFYVQVYLNFNKLS